MKAFLLGLVGAFIAVTVVSQEPDRRSWQGVIAGKNEPGERILVKGRVLTSDGRPVGNAQVYAYHTDKKGLYNDALNQQGLPRLRINLLTQASGQFEFETIKPGRYPNGQGPIHIHLEITPSGSPKTFFDLWFDDDEAAKSEESRRAVSAGRAGLLSLKKNRAGLKEASYDVRLPAR